MQKILVDKLIEQCNKKIDGNEMIYNYYGNVCDSCTIYIVFCHRFLDNHWHICIFIGT